MNTAPLVVWLLLSRLRNPRKLFHLRIPTFEAARRRSARKRNAPGRTDEQRPPHLQQCSLFSIKINEGSELRAGTTVSEARQDTHNKKLTILGLPLRRYTLAMLEEVVIPPCHDLGKRENVHQL